MDAASTYSVELSFRSADTRAGTTAMFFSVGVTSSRDKELMCCSIPGVLRSSRSKNSLPQPLMNAFAGAVPYAGAVLRASTTASPKCFTVRFRPLCGLVRLVCIFCHDVNWEKRRTSSRD